MRDLTVRSTGCTVEEGGPLGVRVNAVMSDAVLRGSGIWSTAWREERARAYGIAPEQLEEYYRQRTTLKALKVNVLPADVAEAVLFCASDRSAKTSGSTLTVTQLFQPDPLQRAAWDEAYQRFCTLVGAV